MSGLRINRGKVESAMRWRKHGDRVTQADIADKCRVSRQAVAKWFQQGSVPYERIDDFLTAIGKEAKEVCASDRVELYHEREVLQQQLKASEGDPEQYRTHLKHELCWLTKEDCPFGPDKPSTMRTIFDKIIQMDEAQQDEVLQAVLEIKKGNPANTLEGGGEQKAG